MMFAEILGPLGEKEFQQLKQKGLTAKNLEEYFSQLKKLKVISANEDFKKKIKLLFTEKRDQR